MKEKLQIKTTRRSIEHINDIYFSILSKPVDGVSYEISSLKSCREGFCNGICKYIQTGTYEDFTGFDNSTLRFCIPVIDSLKREKESIKRAMVLINRYCTTLKIPGIRLVVADYYIENRQAFMLVANKKWRIFPAMTSFLLLILRIYLNDEIRSIGRGESETEFWKYLCTEFSYDDDVVSFCTKHYSKFQILIDNYDTIFKDYEEDTFSKTTNHVGLMGGLLRLCEFNTYDPIINKRFYECCVSQIKDIKKPYSMVLQDLPIKVGDIYILYRNSTAKEQKEYEIKPISSHFIGYKCKIKQLGNFITVILLEGSTKGINVTGYIVNNVLHTMLKEIE